MSALQKVTAGANESNLLFLIAGGHAVIAHGHQRNTFDLDFIIRQEDTGQWRQLASRLGYKLYREAATFVQFNPGNTQDQPLDLMIVNSETFGKLAAESVPAPPGTVPARIVSLAHLLALKCHAIKHGSERRIVKDADDVIRLIQANRLDINASEWRQLFLKHGTSEFYEKIRRACGQS